MGLTRSLPKPTGASRDAATSAPDRRLSTPRFLLVVAWVSIGCALLVGAVGTWQLMDAYRTSTAAADDTAQLIRIQTIQSSLLRADAIATNAYLVGGLEPETQADAYDAAILDVTQTITAAARAQPADQAALTQLNTDVVAYVGMVELAKANNRQGLPVGAEYLKQASTNLREDAMPILDTLTRYNADRATAAMSSNRPLVFVLCGVGALVGLIVCQLAMARRFRRVVNIQLAVACLAVLAAVIIGGLGLQSRTDAGGRITHGSFTQVGDLSRAKIRGNDAKAYESLTLIARGSGAAYEAAWKASAATVRSALVDQPEVARSWAAYEAAHRQVRADDDGGNWDRAVAESIHSGPANTAFTTFDTSATRALDQASTQTRNALHASRGGLIPVAGLVALLSILAVILSARGVVRRLQEFS